MAYKSYHNPVMIISVRSAVLKLGVATLLRVSNFQKRGAKQYN
jgi:hypothetical protein